MDHVPKSDRHIQMVYLFFACIQSPFPSHAKYRLPVRFFQPGEYIDFCHQFNCFLEGDDDFLLVGEVIVGEGAAATVFEPFVANLVAANLEFPDFRWDPFEVLGVIDQHP